MTQTLYKNFKLFDGNKFKIQENAWFVVDNESGKITKLGFNESPDMENAVDLKNKYVMPGLVNAHTHIMMNPQTNKLNYLSEAEVTFTALKNLKELLKSGVTYVRDCGCAFVVDI